MKTKRMQKLPLTLNQRRNPVAGAPILRKGGVHQRSRTAERGQTRCQLRRECQAWPQEQCR